MAWTSSALQKHSVSAPNAFFSFSSRPQSLLPNSTSCHLLFPRTSRLSSFVLSTPSPCCCVTRVSTAPVEYASPAEPEFDDFSNELARLRQLRSQLTASRSLKEKHRRLETDLRVKEFFRSGSSSSFSRILKLLNLDTYELFLLKCLVAAGQEHVLDAGVGREEEHMRSSIKTALYALVDMIESLDMNGGEGPRNRKSGETFEDAEVGDLKKLLKTLREIEQFYDCIGGVIGYQIKVLELIKESTLEMQSAHWPQPMVVAGEPQYVIHSPNGVDLSRDTNYASQASLWGIEGLPDLGEIYPLGGSADRLGLVDDAGECLPAAMLPYCGRTLLEGLIRDLQAREFLYFKLYGRQCITPVAIMTSSAKKNHERITSLCVKLEWFGRGQSSFQLFEQPLVPAVSGEDGRWVVRKPLEPVCKPGGHGVIWKLAHDKGVFEWFFRHGRKGATVRQVSNVVAATDVTLLALSGIGIHYEKKLGFASCRRNLAATEGINVLIEKKNPNKTWSYGLSCIEYTEFDKFGISEGSVSANRLQSDFPANTNILYVDLRCAAQVASCKDERSLPGMVLNMKKPVVYVDQFGKRHSVTGGRLESTMQNIADNFSNTFPYPPYNAGEGDLDTFLVYNERRKVTSSAKKKRKNLDKSLHQTPEGSFLDIMRNAYDLLSYCNIRLPEIEGNDRYVESGPPFIVLLHPALGPLWEVTRQKNVTVSMVVSKDLINLDFCLDCSKFSGGSICKGSELKVEVAEFQWRDVHLDGSLIVEAESIMGSTRMGSNAERILEYGLRCGRCRLQNVKVLNEGIDWKFQGNIYWKHDVRGLESLKIILHGNAEFEANDVTIQGDHVFEVPNGHKLKIMPGISGLDVQLHPIAENALDSGSWHWNYKINGSHIQLDLIES